MADQRDPVTIPDSHLPELALSHRLRQADLQDVIDVTLHLRHREPLDILQAQEAQSPHERDYLSCDDFEQRHGIRAEDREKVEKFAREHHLAIDEIDAGACTVELKGTVEDCNRAFGVELEIREDVRGTCRAHEGMLQVPGELSSVIEGVTGLDDTLSHPHVDPKTVRKEVQDLPEAPGMFQSYYPTDVAGYYNFPKNLDGSGETIGIIVFGGGYQKSDITNYFQPMNIDPPEVVDIPVTGNRPNSVNKMFDMEVTADVQIAGAIAPGAKIVVYFADTSQPKYWLRALKRAVFDQENRPSVISISFGYVEGKVQPQQMRLFNRLVQTASTMGITVCAASGDGGSPTRAYGDFSSPAAHVNFPANCPYVLACGGTTLETEKGVIVREAVWNHLNQCMGSTGGGLSTIFKRPPYQQNMPIPRNVNVDVTLRGRGIPDVAGNAAHISGYNILFNGQWIRGAAGTSFVAPLWAGLIARLNQGLKRRCGFINPWLYRLAETGAFQQITEGHNGAYQAGPVWNACTGLGRPDGERLLHGLSGLRSTGSQFPGGFAIPEVEIARSAALSAMASAAQAAAALNRT